jgi:EAL domain-containing protein (putative c-di-GMP-specific phosphodiesterase class I)
MSVVAEDIETPEQQAILLEMACDYGQGYLFARPMPKADVDTMIAGRTPIAARPAPAVGPVAIGLAN